MHALQTYPRSHRQRLLWKGNSNYQERNMCSYPSKSKIWRERELCRTLKPLSTFGGLFSKGQHPMSSKKDIQTSKKQLTSLPVRKKRKRFTSLCRSKEARNTVTNSKANPVEALSLNNSLQISGIHTKGRSKVNGSKMESKVRQATPLYAPAAKEFLAKPNKASLSDDRWQPREAKRVATCTTPNSDNVYSIVNVYSPPIITTLKKRTLMAGSGCRCLVCMRPSMPWQILNNDFAIAKKNATKVAMARQSTNEAYSVPLISFAISGSARYLLPDWFHIRRILLQIAIAKQARAASITFLLPLNPPLRVGSVGLPTLNCSSERKSKRRSKDESRKYVV